MVVRNRAAVGARHIQVAADRTPVGVHEVVHSLAVALEVVRSQVAVPWAVPAVGRSRAVAAAGSRGG